MKRKWITRADVSITALILVCALSLFLVTRPRDKGEHVSVYLENELVAEFSLFDAPERYEITTEKGSVILGFDGDGAFVLRSDCPDDVCVRTGHVSCAGESIVCVPLGVCITVEGGGLDGVTG